MGSHAEAAETLHSESFDSVRTSHDARNHPRGTKRKAEFDSAPSTQSLEEPPSHNGDDLADDRIRCMVHEINTGLHEAVPDETIQLCGKAPLRIILENPDEVLRLAYNKLNTWPFHEVHTCWRRLYEEACLYKVTIILRSHAGTVTQLESASSKLKQMDRNPQNDDWITEVVLILDKGLTISGAPSRRKVIETVIQRLSDLIGDSSIMDVPDHFVIDYPKALLSACLIRKKQEYVSFGDFQSHLDENMTPLIMPDALDQWPASNAWQSPAYFMRLTLGGRRTVPIEIGKSYVEEGWTQRVMSFRQFMEDHLLAQTPQDVGYLAQHDLFAQIPALRNDIMIPDYCYTSPPILPSANLDSAVLSSVRQLDEPLLNAWFGPRGTKTPLHTDPYHNILCQVVGYKYIRLYSPSEKSKLYPRGSNEKGVDMSNTSQVDVSHSRPQSLDGCNDPDTVRRIDQEFPMFEEARFQEAILGPGECLYIPVGWWHYVESLSTSFSVSFWWN